MNLETSEIQKDKQAGFVRRLFQGDISLPITYWIFNVLAGVVFQVVLKIIELNYFDITTTKIGAWSVIGFYWFVVGYSIFILIAIWRSAGKYQGRAIWAGLSRVAVVLGTFGLVGNLIIGYEQNSDTDLALREEIKTLNASLPNMIDNDTRLDHVSIQEKDLYYNYTLAWISTEDK
jgi:hypothetical protein